MFHNILIAPGVTASSGQNPSYALLDLLDTDVPSATNLTMVFLQVEKTYGWENVPFDYGQWPLVTVDFEKQYGVKDLSAEEIYGLMQRLKNDKDLMKRYMAWKIGFDPSDPEQ